MTPPPPSQTSPSPEGNLYIVGRNVTHTIAPQMHNFIAQTQLGRNWVFAAKECETVHDAVATFRAPGFVGGVVTMPYKTAIMEYLDELDEVAVQVGACNGVHVDEDGKGGRRLVGTNTDWLGVGGCLTAADGAGEDSKGRGRPACIIGAGGASHAAVYALWAQLGCPVIYIINRDREEVEALMRDVHRMAELMQKTGPEIVHLTSLPQAEGIASGADTAPYYIVGTVPDFEPATPSEILARDMLDLLLNKSPVKGVLLDMCFKPRVTRHIKLALRYGWKTVEGTEIIGHQTERQWWLWTGRGVRLSADQQGEAWRALRAAAEGNAAINF